MIVKSFNDLLELQLPMLGYYNVLHFHKDNGNLDCSFNISFDSMLWSHGSQFFVKTKLEAGTSQWEGDEMSKLCPIVDRSSLPRNNSVRHFIGWGYHDQNLSKQLPSFSPPSTFHHRLNHVINIFGNTVLSMCSPFHHQSSLLYFFITVNI